MTKKKATHHKDDLLEEYAKWLFNTGRALETIFSYKTDTRMYHAFLDEKVAGSDQLLSRFLFVKHKEHLLNEDMAISTINKKINSLKVYS